MTLDTRSATAGTPSLARLATTTAIAVVVAGVLLVTVVLPAEYGLDPLGTGRWLGLTDIAAPPVAIVETVRAEGAPLRPVQRGPVGEYPSDFAFDVFELELEPYEYVEYKYRLEQGATMLYAWTASGPVDHDFHGDREGGANADGPAEVSYDKDTRRQASGSFTAPFTGIHGWFWENSGSDRVTIRLTSSGFYTSAVEIRSDRSRHPRTLQRLDALPSPSSPPQAGAGSPD